MTQKEALQILKTGANVFLTGAAGSGKTHVLREYLRILKERKIPVGITASTGIAATHMGGVTIHSWAGIGVKDSLSDWEIDELSQKERLSTKMRSAKVLIIDEISMLHDYRLDMIDRILRYVRNCEDAFGGLQVIVSGDFFQLPPVSRENRTIADDGGLFSDGDAPQTSFAYNSSAWRRANFAVCYLGESHRQNDDAYLDILNAIRNSEVDDAIVAKLKTRMTKSVEVTSGRNGKTTPVAITRLYSHNANVDVENERELAKLSTPMIKYEMHSRGKANLVENLKKSCLAPEILKLKAGAKVMFVKNNFEKGYVNGTVGTVVACSPFEITVSTARGNVAVEKDTWTIEDDGKILAEIEQYPLRLAWAITIHKSQGMSIDSALIDLSKSFEKGMGYVALSRVRSLDGLSLLGMNKMALEIHDEVLQFDKLFREMSEKVRLELSVLGPEELKRRELLFLGPEPEVKDATARRKRNAHARR